MITGITLCAWYSSPVPSWSGKKNRFKSNVTLKEENAKEWSFLFWVEFTSNRLNFFLFFFFLSLKGGEGLFAEHFPGTAFMCQLSKGSLFIYHVGTAARTVAGLDSHPEHEFSSTFLEMVSIFNHTSSSPRRKAPCSPLTLKIIPDVARTLVRTLLLLCLHILYDERVKKTCLFLLPYW